jgi:uncharacterized protein YigE (DUF2233 family)
MADQRRRAVLWTLLAALATGWMPGGAAAAEDTCRDIAHEGLKHTICDVAAGGDLRLWLRGADGAILGGFAQVDALLAPEGRGLVFAMNAGMYHPDRRPVGLYVEDGAPEGRLITAAGPGNFGMLPNGVFCIGDDRFAVIESRRFAADPPACRYATQSGPMLVIDGALHPRFLPDSTSRYRRNGVGVSADGKRAVFAISAGTVTFHEFARLFRDGLGLPDALYLDGNISRLHAPGLGRSDPGFAMGPIVGLVGPADATGR